tara:strand:+ start:1796 stop:2857 length:1062 start_codon:yes stop_codon:yes gene_type:complete
MRILVTGGYGFIGGNLIRKLLLDTSDFVFNIDKLSYASDSKKIESLPRKVLSDRYCFKKVNLADISSTYKAIKESDPDLVMHLAAESHVDRSIESPFDFVQSNVIGTFNLLEAVKEHWQSLPMNRKNKFRFHHISTDEVFGTLDAVGKFNEKSPYDPRSPYSATKASSDHLVRAWYHSYGLPILITNCSNNYGPWQFPEKLIPNVILKAIDNLPIPIYGDGSNMRDWLYIDDHISALILVALQGEIGKTYCIGGGEEFSNLEVAQEICHCLNQLKPQEKNYEELISFVEDRPGHDYRYSIDATNINNLLGWEPEHTFNKAILKTVKWYIKNLDWCQSLMDNSGYEGNRIGLKK